MGSADISQKNSGNALDVLFCKLYMVRKDAGFGVNHMKLKIISLKVISKEMFVVKHIY